VSALQDKNIKDLIQEHVVFYGKAEKFYKETTTVEHHLNASLLNEFRYCARSQKEALNLLFTSDAVSHSDVLKLIEPATRALKCVVNDSIDILVTFVKSFAKVMSDLYPGVEISDIYGIDNYIGLWNSIAYFEKRIAESRDLLHDRVAIYEELLASNELKSILNFLSNKEIIEAKAAREADRIKKEFARLEEEKAVATESLRLSQLQLLEAQKSSKTSNTSLNVAYVGLFVAVLALMFQDEVKAGINDVKCKFISCKTTKTS
jgi:hypothetical protein